MDPEFLTALGSWDLDHWILWLFPIAMFLYARGWRPPILESGTPWLLVECGASAMPGVEAAFEAVPDARFVILPEAGLLVYHSHPDAVVELFADHAARGES